MKINILYDKQAISFEVERGEVWVLQQIVDFYLMENEPNTPIEDVNDIYEAAEEIKQATSELIIHTFGGGFE